MKRSYMGNYPRSAFVSSTKLNPWRKNLF